MAQFSLIKTPAGRRLRIEGELPDGFQGEAQGGAWLCPLDAGNAAALRRHLPWTAPVPVGLRKSVGCGDRLGLATPGHLLAVRAGDMFPVLAQQSIREMTRSRRTPQQVLDDATWGVFEADYRDGFGSDADHLKNTESIDRCIAAGYIGFTLDPGDHVDNAAHTDDPAALQAKYAALPWDALETTPNDLRQRYLGPSLAGAMSEQMLLRAACKYGPALAAAVQLARHIAAGMDGRPYDLEISVDETETPTSPAEHYFIASELLRLGVPFQGLAPRFVGRFEKGVDYIGDLAAFDVLRRATTRLGAEGVDRMVRSGLIDEHTTRTGLDQVWDTPPPARAARSAALLVRNPGLARVMVPALARAQAVRTHVGHHPAEVDLVALDAWERRTVTLVGPLPR